MKKGLKLISLIVGVTAIMVLALGGAVSADTSGEMGVQTQCAGDGWHGFQGKDATCSETVSELLGITSDELCELRQEGSSLAEIAAEQGVTVDDLVAAIVAERTAVVQARVDDGTLTQEQADAMIQRMAERTELAVTRTTSGPVEWRMGGQNGGGTCFGSSKTGTGQDGMMNKGSRRTI